MEGVVFVDIKCAPPAKSGKGLEIKTDFGGQILKIEWGLALRGRLNS